MDSIKAVCPKCETVYQLTEDQLNVAGGKVRCGKCMTIFQAKAAPKPQSAPKPQTGFQTRVASENPGWRSTGRPRPAGTSLYLR